MGLIKHKILQLLLTKRYNKSWKKVLALPPTCPSPLPLCSKLPLFAAILRQQQVEKIIKNRYNNRNNTILYANIFIEVHWFCQITNPHQQPKHIP